MPRVAAPGDLATPLAAVAAAMDDRLTEQWLIARLLVDETDPAVLAGRVARIEAVHAELAALNRRLWRLVEAASAP